jgi:tight adherence protein B
MTLYVAATFFGVLGLIVGIYWVLVAVPESRQRGHMERRLRSQPKPKARLVGSVVKPEDRLSSVGPLNAVLGRMARLSRPLRMVITQADLSITVGTLVLTCGVAGLSAWLLAAWFSGLWWLGLALGPVVGYLPLAAVRQRASRRILKFEEQFPDALDLASRALRAGHAFTTGLAMVAEEAPQPVAAEFRTLYEQQSFGMPLPDAMRAFAERIPLLDARFFVTAVLTQRDAGGNLAEILDNLASVIRERFKVKRQVRVLTAHARITGFVLAALPPVLAVAFLITSPDHIMMLVKDPLGVKMIVAAATLQILGTLVIRRLVDIEY